MVGCWCYMFNEGRCDVFDWGEPHPSIHAKFYGSNQMLSDKYTWPWVHWLLFDLGEVPTPRLAGIMVKIEPAPIDNRRSLCKKHTVALADVKRMALRNKGNDGQVCPNVGQESWRCRIGRCWIEIGAEREERP
ncbi:hypothetical protein TNCV_1652861 [Trichonephila clavipes]|nr:hypothetical protein TNCV_1652861 [Trichonephila clavipes]